MARVPKVKSSKGARRVEKHALPADGDVSAPVDAEPRDALDRAALDEILGLQLLVAWAGEGATDPPRLRWWRTSLVDEFGGEDLFKRLAPRTWKWAVLEAARVAARMTDAEARSHAAEGDQLISLFHFGFSIDEQLDDRLAELKRAVPEPLDVLPALSPMAKQWNQTSLVEHLRGLASVTTVPSPIGLRLKGAMPSKPELAARMLAAALGVPSDRYPAAHWKVEAT